MAIASDSARDRFDRDGFVVIENVLDAAELESLGAAVDAAVRARAGTDNRPVSEKPDYEQMFQQCMNLWEDNPGVRALTFHQGLGELAASLLGAETLRIWIDQALYKEPGGRPTDPHQDWPLWPISPARQVTAWIPFEGSTVSSGAMGYSPGSHHVGIADFSDVDRQVRATAHGDDVPYPCGERTEIDDPEWVEAPVGSVVFHHSMTVHRAGANTTDRTRRVYCIAYFEDGCVRSTSHPHQSVDRQRTEAGQPIQGPVTPVAWPRPEGDLPEPPPMAMGQPPRTGFQ